MLSTDFQDKVFSKEYKTDYEVWEERDRYVRRRKEAFGEVVTVFEELKSIKKLLIWQMRVLEELTMAEIAEIVGYTEARVSQILREIKVKSGNLKKTI
jgi:DNA-directed RNA polymerase specialized sigma subunit